MIRLPVQAGDEEVQVNFIVLEAYSPYTAILARPWLHAMGAVSLTLHQKVKYPIQGRMGELVYSQAMFGVSNYTAFCRSCCGSKGSCPIATKGPYRGQQAKACGELSKELEKVVIAQDEKRYFQVGS